MLIWPLLVLGAVAAGAGIGGVLAWWPSPGRCVACAALVVAGAVVSLVAASAGSPTTNGDVAALVLLALVGAEIGAVVASVRSRSERGRDRGVGEP
jgi:NADH:ubiquinone oxidoreductase subunit K